MDLTDKQFIYDYDEMSEPEIDTKLFTNLDGVEIIDNKHPFISFLNGFTHNMIDIEIYHGWYHIETKSAKFILLRPHPSKVGNIIHTAWQKYWKNNYYEYDIGIYYKYCGKLYRSDEYEINQKVFYRDFMKRIIDQMVD